MDTGWTGRKGCTVQSSAADLSRIPLTCADFLFTFSLKTSDSSASTPEKRFMLFSLSCKRTKGDLYYQ